MAFLIRLFNLCAHGLFQSPFPARGTTAPNRLYFALVACFNPRPLRGTIQGERIGRCTPSVSILVSLAGDDTTSTNLRATLNSFNPHPHKGDDATTPLNIHGGYWFQSPFPVRGRSDVLPVPIVPQTFQSPFPVRGTTAIFDRIPPLVLANMLSLWLFSTKIHNLFCT